MNEAQKTQGRVGSGVPKRRRRLNEVLIALLPNKGMSTVGVKRSISSPSEKYD